MNERTKASDQQWAERAVRLMLWRVLMSMASEYRLAAEALRK